MAPKILCVIFALLFVMSFSHSLLGVGQVKVGNVLTYLQDFHFDYGNFFEIVERFDTGWYMSKLHTWNDDLPFLTNISLSVSSWFTWINSIVGDFLAFPVLLIWDIVVLVFDVVVLLCRLCGIPV